MKPIRLELKEFGPYKDEIIEWDRIINEPIFLITGKTGSGKSTLFDAITYALYNKTTGGKDISSLRTKTASDKDKTQVNFDFELSGKRYRIERTLAYLKTGNKNLTSGKVALMKYNDEELEVIATKEQEVKEKVEELIGLDDKQFCQIIILPQGKFKEFLLSKSSEKKETLRSLFNTYFYQKFVDQLQEQAKKLDSNNKQKEKELITRFEQFDIDGELIKFEFLKDENFKEINEIILSQENEIETEKKELDKLNAVEISDVINQFEVPEIIIMIFRLLKKDKAADVFSYLDSDHQEIIIHASTDIETRELFDELYFDDIVDIIEEMPFDIVKKILKNTDKKDRHLINQLLKYPDNSAGSIMTTEYVDLRKNMKVSEAIEEIRKTGKDKENIYTCYVTNESGKLEGVLLLRELIAKKDSTLVSDIMSTNFISANTNDDQEIVADLFKKYDLIVMPVVDHENKLLGIITVDDVLEVVDQEITEDFHKIAGITSPTDDSYLKTNIFTMAKQRIGWLAVLMISDTISGNIIQGYESVLARSIILTAFIPMLMSTGGNVGSQSSTVVIRALALGEISPKNAFKVLKKEFSIGIIVSIVLALLNFVRLIMIEKINIPVAFTVSITLVFTIIISKIVGALLPLLAKIVKADPAVMATPLITTISDAVTLVIYFSFATTILKL